MKNLREQFLRLIYNNDFDGAESLIASDIFAVEDMMDEMSEEDYKKLEKHWSAVQTGEQIITPIKVLKEISDSIGFKNNSHLIDVGSGHGHPAFVFGILNPGMKITGYEIVKEKIIGSNQTKEKLKLTNIDFIEQDLSDINFKVPIADYYYFYNPLNPEFLKRLCKRLKFIAQEKEITVISTNGEDVQFLKEEGFIVFKELIDSGILFLSIKD